MAEVTALKQSGCPACGAKAEWNPAKQALTCGYCGTVAPYEVDGSTGEVREIDLVTALREMPEELRGWKTKKHSVRCRSCDAISVFDPSRVGQNCQFCGSPELVDYDEIKAPIRPLSLLPFKLDEIRIRERLRRWYAQKWLAPSRFKKKAMVDTVNGVYLPYWTFDAHVDCDWTAESGEYYYTTRTVRDSAGKRRTERVRHVRWRPASGDLRHFFDDQPVPGTQGADPTLLGAIEPFPTNDLVPYDTAYLSGFVVEHYQVVLIDAARQARTSMDLQLHQLCGAQVPGDTFRNLRIKPRYKGQTFKHILVPVWVLSYHYRGKAYQLLANGYTGKIAGRYPKSPWKILGLVALAALALGLMFWIGGANL